MRSNYRSKYSNKALINRNKNYANSRNDLSISSYNNRSKIFLAAVIFLVIILLLLITTSQSTTTTSPLLLHKIAKSDSKYCSSGYKLERHTYQHDHGDICRSYNSENYVCPFKEFCREVSGGKAPYCQMSKSVEPCRIERESFVKPFRCDDGTGFDLDRDVCIMVEDGEAGMHRDETCDYKCAANKKRFKCKNDWDCSLAGICTDEGTCLCDAWTEGIDCSYLKFQPVSTKEIGYISEIHSSWGGNAIYIGSKWHLFVTEIRCASSQATNEKRCGLSSWQHFSQVAHAVSDQVTGPYKRVSSIIETTYAHNPTVHVWNSTAYLYYISKYNGPTKVKLSFDSGKTWSNKPILLSAMQNPAPFIHENGSMSFYYRNDFNLPKPTCSQEGIGRIHCDSPTFCSSESKKSPVFSHTAEDPFVFQDVRGNYHMLMNALPYKCTPKWNQGGHAWSRNGIDWSEPRVGAFNTTISYYSSKQSSIQSMTCERRERPQMILHPDTQVPHALVTALVNCPENDEFFENFQHYRGGDDSITLIQLMNQ